MPKALPAEMASCSPPGPRGHRGSLDASFLFGNDSAREGSFHVSDSAPIVRPWKAFLVGWVETTLHLQGRLKAAASLLPFQAAICTLFIDGVGVLKSENRTLLTLLNRKAKSWLMSNECGCHGRGSGAEHLEGLLKE